MVHRKKDFTKSPPGLIDPKWDTLKADMLIEQQAHKAKSACYRDTTLDWLRQMYSNKCAYCERKRGIELQVDHYRPKKPRNNNSAKKYNQPGYYWLCYTWSNLIPLCSRCNGSKSNKFPLAGWTETNRIDSHAHPAGSSLVYDIHWLQDQERPLLLHPEVEAQPERHFIFSKNGTIRGRTPRGEETIAICQLNRKDLRRERVKIRQDYVDALNADFDAFLRNKDRAEFRGAVKSTFRSIKRGIHKDEAHSLFHLYLYRYFEYFIVPFVASGVQAIVKRYFADFKGK